MRDSTPLVVAIHPPEGKVEVPYSVNVWPRSLMDAARHGPAAVGTGPNCRGFSCAVLIDIDGDEQIASVEPMSGGCYLSAVECISVYTLPVDGAFLVALTVWVEPMLGFLFEMCLEFEAFMHK